jgi:hypothetical protein
MEAVIVKPVKVKLTQQEYNKAYRVKNKEKLSNQLSERIRCEDCNVDISRWNMYKHKQSKKHRKVPPEIKPKKLSIDEKLNKIEKDLADLLEMKNDIVKLTAKMNPIVLNPITL